VDAALELVAPEGCGSEAELGASITRRSDRIRLDPTSARRLRIQIRADGKLTRVDLELIQPSGRPSKRTLRATSCDEALEAAALVAAVSLDPTASAALDPPPAPETPPPKPPPPKPQPPKPPPSPSPPPPAHHEGLVASFAVVGEVVWRPAPEPMLGAGVVVALMWERNSVLSPSIRLRGGGAWARKDFPDREAPGFVRFRLFSGTLELCPIRLGVPTLAIVPCVFGTGGQLWAAGRQFPRIADKTNPWWVAGGSAVALIQLVGLPEVQLGGRIGWNQRQDSFTLSGPSERIHRVRPVSGAFGLGLGFVFP
jgi:hypothetical protein